MNGRTKGGRERERMDGRETLPSSTKGRLTFGCHPCQCRWHVSLQCRTAAAASFLPSVVRLHRIGSNEEAAVTLKRTIRGPYLSGRPLEGGTKDERARAKSCPPSCRILLFFERVIVVTPEQEDNLCISYSYASEWSYPPRRGTMEARTRGENWQSFPGVTQFASCVLHSVWA